jgi:DNA invertase Pin-like site-specific DNA recombinase
MIYGYAQLSTDGQSVASQMEQLRAAGAEKVYREKRGSGARADGVQLRRVLAHHGKGDVLTVTRLDHLARSTRDLLNTLAAITAKGAGFRSLGDTWAERRPKLTEHQRREAIKRRDEGVETLAEIGRSYNVSVTTFRGSRRD